MNTAMRTWTGGGCKTRKPQSLPAKSRTPNPLDGVAIIGQTPTMGFQPKLREMITTAYSFYNLRGMLIDKGRIIPR